MLIVNLPKIDAALRDWSYCWQLNYQNAQPSFLIKVKALAGGGTNHWGLAARRRAHACQTENRALLAAIVYDPGFPIDELVLAIARNLRSEGVRLRGVVQENAGVTSCAAMTLIDLATGERFSISQDLGAEARGCRLDPRGLADVAARIDAAVNADFDLAILNKFGKAEAEGAGLRSTFAHAIGVGKPILSSVREPFVEAWSRFHGGLAIDLPTRPDVVIAWCRSIISSR
jgi:hypothetical protein